MPITFHEILKKNLNKNQEKISIKPSKNITKNSKPYSFHLTITKVYFVTDEFEDPV